MREERRRDSLVIGSNWKRYVQSHDIMFTEMDPTRNHKKKNPRNDV